MAQTSQPTNVVTCPHCGYPYPMTGLQLEVYYGRNMGCMNCGHPFKVEPPPPPSPPAAEELQPTEEQPQPVPHGSGAYSAAAPLADPTAPAPQSSTAPATAGTTAAQATGPAT